MIEDTPYAQGIDAGHAQWIDNVTPANPFEPSSHEWRDFQRGTLDGWGDAYAFYMQSLEADT